LVRETKNADYRSCKLAVGVRLLGPELNCEAEQDLQHKGKDFRDLLSEQPKNIWFGVHKTMYHEQLEY
jgi:hypothetical protein